MQSPVNLQTIRDATRHDCLSLFLTLNAQGFGLIDEGELRSCDEPLPLLYISFHVAFLEY